MKMSLSQVRETTVRAAASRRLAPELADTLGEAVSWLCAAGFDGVSTALLALGDALDAPAKTLELGFAHGELRAPPGPALLSAPEIVAFLAREPRGRSARLEGPDAALLVLGCAGVESRRHGVAFAVECGGKEVVIDAGEVTERPRGDLALAGVPVRITFLGAAEEVEASGASDQIEVFGPIHEALDRIGREHAA